MPQDTPTGFSNNNFVAFTPETGFLKESSTTPLRGSNSSSVLLPSLPKGAEPCAAAQAMAAELGTPVAHITWGEDPQTAAFTPLSQLVKALEECFVSAPRSSGMGRGFNATPPPPWYLKTVDPKASTATGAVNDGTGQVCSGGHLHPAGHHEQHIWTQQDMLNSTCVLYRAGKLERNMYMESLAAHTASSVLVHSSCHLGKKLDMCTMLRLAVVLDC